MTITGGIFKGNDADGGGGAIYVNDTHDEKPTLNITGADQTVEFDWNVANPKMFLDPLERLGGGSICIADGKVNINNANFADAFSGELNEGYGAHIDCRDDDGTTISNCNFEETLYGPVQKEIYIDTDNVKLYNVTIWGRLVAKGNDIEIGGKFVCQDLYLGQDGTNISRIYLKEDLKPYSSINIDMNDIDDNDVLVYCKGSALAANNFRYFHVTANGIRAMAGNNNQIRTAPRGDYTEPDTLKNEFPTREYKIGIKTAGGWADEGDNAVHINIIGSMGETGKIKLDPDGSFEPNSYNEFTFTAPDIGIIEKFEITYNAINDWKMRWIDIEGKRIERKINFEDKGTVVSIDWATGDVKCTKGDISIGSVFGEGSVWVIVGVAVVLVAAAVTTVIVVKKKKKAAVAVADGTEAEETKTDNSEE